MSVLTHFCRHRYFRYNSIFRNQFVTSREVCINFERSAILSIQAFFLNVRFCMWNLEFGFFSLSQILMNRNKYKWRWEEWVVYTVLYSVHLFLLNSLLYFQVFEWSFEWAFIIFTEQSENSALVHLLTFFHLRFSVSSSVLKFSFNLKI